MTKIYHFQEHNLVIEGEKEDLLYLADILRDAEGTLGDLRYQIEYAFDIDNVRSYNDEENYDPDYSDNYLKEGLLNV